MKISRTKFLLALAAVPLALVTACGGGGGDGLDDRLDLADPQLRYVHAIPFGPNLTMNRNNNDEARATNIAYKFASTYFDIRTEDTDVAAKLAGTGTQVGTLPRFRADRGHKYTVVALPGAAQADLMLIDDPYTKALGTNNARARALNASINAQNVDVYLTQPGVDINTVGPRFAAVGYKAAVPASGSDSIDNLEGGTYALTVTTAGTKNVIFNNTVNLDKNADWLIMTIPSAGIGVAVPNDIKVLVARTDDSGQTTLEISDAP